MVQSLPAGYVFDPADPRAPSMEQWDRMSPDERRRVVDRLPALVPLDLLPAEGDRHRKAASRALDELDRFYRGVGRRVYVSSNLGVYYPREPRFAPDLLAVLDVELRERDTWVVAAEGKGLDFVLEVHVSGDRQKDELENVARYARLGIHEYAVFDRGRQHLSFYRLPAGGGAYQRLVPQAGRFPSVVLGLDLALEGPRLRFLAGNAALEDADEMIGRLGGMMDAAIARKEELERQLQERDQQLAEERRLREEREKQLEEQLAEARAEIERLKASR